MTCDQGEAPSPNGAASVSVGRRPVLRHRFPKLRKSQLYQYI